MLSLLLGCRAPTFEAVVRPAGDAVPLSFALDLTSSDEASPVIRWTDGDHERVVRLPPGRRWRDRLLVGFRPDRTYSWSVLVEERVVAEGELDVPALAEVYRPDVELVVAEPDRMQPGYTLVPYWGSGEDHDAVAVLDAEGEVVYLQEVGEEVLDARTIDGGLQLLVGGGLSGQQLWEVDWRGEWIRGFHAAESGGLGIPVELPGRLQHDAVALDDGGFVVLSARLRAVEGYPSSYDGTAPAVEAQIWEDVVVRFGADGGVAWELPLGDVLDPTRIGFDGLSEHEDGLDWGHANALWVQDDGRVGVSLRNQDAVVLLDPVTAEVSWILAPPANWELPWSAALLAPTGELEWPSHQHAARVDADGLVTLFDNGNARASPGEVPVAALPPETERYSRVVRYAVDEQAGTARQVAELGLLGSVGTAYCPALGDADPQPNGNVLGVFGRIATEAGTYNEARGLGRHATRIVEWDPTGREVFHLHLSTDGERWPGGWSTYRVERFPDLPTP